MIRHVLIMLFLLILHRSVGQINAVRISADNFENVIEEITFVPVQELDQSFAFTIPMLPEGLHQLYISVRDINGAWSFYAQKPILIEGEPGQQNLVSIEYFVDASPIVGTGNTISVTGQFINQQFSIPVVDIEPGIHVITFRVQNETGKWSFPFARIFLVEGGPGSGVIEGAEYFIDSDPGEGNGIPISLQPGNSVTVEFDWFADPVYAVGTHQLFVRARDGDGIWSFVATVSFDLYDDLICPHDLNNDDVINVTDLLIFIGQYGNTGELSADYDNSGRVGIADLIQLLAALNTSCLD